MAETRKELKQLKKDQQGDREAREAIKSRGTSETGKPGDDGLKSGPYPSERRIERFRER